MGVYLLIGVIVECARLILRGSLGKLKGLLSDLKEMGWKAVLFILIPGELVAVLLWPLMIIMEIVCTIKRW